MNNSYINQGRKPIPLYGTTIYIGEVKLQTIYGVFRAITFQDIIHKGYIVALVYGDLTVSPLYIRMHSSCITSECLMSMDCDCVEQLEGALRKISTKGNGVLFYLLQEGRGSGYVAKARDRMHVQYTQGTDKEISTFQAYNKMGLKKDYRDYRNIKDICHILDITTREFVMITNNPDKITGFKQQGLILRGVESIDIQPGPFNIAYLKSKQESGHMIYETKKKTSLYKIPYERVIPFEPFVFKEIQRFVFVSAYYLPIKPIHNELYFTADEYKLLMNAVTEEDKKTLVIQIVGHRYFVKFPSAQVILRYGELTVKPYWFKAHVFYDVAHSTDYIVLTHGLTVGQTHGVDPIVRIQSESIFDRFPLKTKTYKDRYRQTVKAIVRRGKGLIMILYNDGRGTGLGHRILDMQGVQTGISQQSRDFTAITRLLKLFIKQQPFQLYGGITSYKGLKKSMACEGLNPTSILLFNKEILNVEDLNLSVNSLRQRMNELPAYLELVKSQMLKANFPQYPKEAMVYATGVGTSQAHARYLSSIAPRVIFKAVQQLMEQSDISQKYIILFSQGLSPNINMVVEKADLSRMLVVTTIREGSSRQDRVKTYLELKQKGVSFVHYQEEVPDNTLVRLQGPAAGYIVCLYFKNSLDGVNMNYTPAFQKPSPALIVEFIKKKQIIFVVPSQLLSLVGNISMKFLEGAFSQPAVFCDQISFSHGYFQYALKKELPIVFVGDVKKQFKKMVDTTCLTEQLQVEGMLTLLGMQIFCNYLMLEYILSHHIDQINWEGKEKDKEMYDVRKYEDL